MSEIKDRTGMSYDERDYRFEKLDALGHIRVEKVEEGKFVGPRAPRVAVLQMEGAEIVEDGISEDAQQHLADHEFSEELADLVERVEMLEARNSTLFDKVNQLEEVFKGLGRALMD